MSRKFGGPFGDRTIPKVAARLDLPTHQLQRAVSHGNVEFKEWAGVRWIPEAEEARLRDLLREANLQGAKDR
jgi:hypothetical protein